MRALFETLIFQPLFNLFVLLYNFIPDFGIVVIIITIIIKILFYPLTKSGLKAQQSLSELQPKMNKIKEDFKGDQQKIAQETMKLYKEHKINPAGSCLPLLLQLPVFIALYWVMQAGLNNESLNLLYPFVKNPGVISATSLGFIDLSKSSLILAILAGAAQFWQAKMMMHKKAPSEAGSAAKDEDMAAIMNKQMLYVMPIMTVIIGMKLPAGLSLYWLVSTLLTGLQQIMLKRQSKKT